MNPPRNKQTKKELKKQQDFLERKKRNQRAYRARKKLAATGEPLRDYHTAECGMPSMYQKGCRCDYCTLAHSIRQNLYNEKLRNANSGDSESSQSDI